MSAIPLRRIEGKYEILDKLREGGMGAIYKVRHRLLDEVRVIKLMRPQFTEDEELKARFVREARLAIKLRHPNIAQLYDFTVDEEDGTAFIIMEFIQGMTLEDILAVNGPPPLGLTLEISHQSLRALGYLHSKGFVHRDISPDNLMLTEDTDGQPLIKLIDLGIAKILGAGGEGHLTQAGTFLGKVRYASPEQFGSEGASQVDIRGDLYSFAVVLYELLTGRYPIQGRDPSSIIAGHLFRPPLAFEETDPAGRVPEGLREVVLKALAKQPGDRFATAQELTRALAAFRGLSDFAEEDLRRILTVPSAATGRGPLTVPGSTQERLDQQFGLDTTPLPRRLEAVQTPPAAEPAPAEKAVQAATATIELELRKGDLPAAEAELRWAVDRYGEQPELRTLRDRLQGMREREAELQAEALAEDGRGKLEAGDLEEARGHLLRARALAPDHGEVAALLEQVDTALRRRSEERRRALELAQAIERIEAALAQGHLLEAETLLFEAEASLREREAFAALYERLEDLQRQAEERRRAEQAEAAAAEIGALLGRGELDEAGKRLSRATATFGDRAAFQDLCSRLETLRRQACEAEVAAIAAAARDLADRDDFKGALKELRRGLKLDPENAELPALIQETEAAQRRRAEEKRRAEQIGKAAAGVEERLRRGDLDQAAKLLAKAVAAHGEAEELARLQERLEEARRAAERAAAVAAVVTEIQAHLDRGELDRAGHLLDRAVVRFGGAEALREQWQRLEVLRRAEVERKTAAAPAEARRRLAEGDLQAALREAHQAVQLAPEDREAQAVRAEVEAACRRRELEARLAAVLRQAQGRLDAGEPEAALEKLREAERLDPGSAEVRALAAGAEAALRRQQEERRREGELKVAVAALENLLDRGETDEAERLLTATIAAQGETDALRRLRSRLEELRKRQRAEEAPQPTPLAGPPGAGRREEDLEAAWEATQTIAELLARREGERALKELHRATARFGDREELQRLRKQIAEMVLEEAPPAPAAEARPEETARISLPPPPAPEPPLQLSPEERTREHPVPEASPPAAVPPSAPPEVEPLWLRWRLWLPAAIACLVVFGFLWQLGRDLPEPDMAPSGPPAASSPPASAAPGTLALDAIPWGEIVQIVDENGASQPLGEEKRTPLTLELPPGRYRVVLRNPNFPQPASLDVQILSGVEHESIADFGTVEEDELFRSLGW